MKRFWKLTPSPHPLKVFYQHFAHPVSHEGQKVNCIAQLPGRMVHVSVLPPGLFIPVQLLFEDLALLTGVGGTVCREQEPK